jgi:uncharacterized protein (DUF488 family)
VPRAERHVTSAAHLAAGLRPAFDRHFIAVKTLWTIGHSNRTLDDFLALLASAQIETLADVRRFPGSRHHPQFNSDALAAALQEAGIAYTHFPALGGRRSTRNPSAQNAGWRVPAFAAYADYMLTQEFISDFEKLVDLSSRSRTAVMCAEVLPWRCHRRLIADQFITHGWRVLDIVGSNQAREHALPPFASVTNGQLSYPAQ